MVSAGGSAEAVGESGAASCATRAAPLESNISIAPTETARRVIFTAIHQVAPSNGTPANRSVHKPRLRSLKRRSVYCPADYSGNRLEKKRGQPGAPRGCPKPSRLEGRVLLGD